MAQAHHLSAEDEESTSKFLHALHCFVEQCNDVERNDAEHFHDLTRLFHRPNEGNVIEWISLELRLCLSSLVSSGSPLLPESTVMTHCIVVGGLSLEHKRLALETQSTNCGNNASLCLQMLTQLSETVDLLSLRTWKIIQDPTMLRRTLMTFAFHLKRVLGEDPSLPSHFETAASEIVISLEGMSVPFKEFCSANCTTCEAQLAALSSNGSLDGNWLSMQHQHSVSCGHGIFYRPYNCARYISLLMGEVPRLRNDKLGYGPKGMGFIDACEVPTDAENAAGTIARLGGDKTRLTPAQ
jgi:hypothetical protein